MGWGSSGRDDRLQEEAAIGGSECWLLLLLVFLESSEHWLGLSGLEGSKHWLGLSAETLLLVEALGHGGDWLEVDLVLSGLGVVAILLWLVLGETRIEWGIEALWLWLLDFLVFLDTASLLGSDLVSGLFTSELSTIGEGSLSSFSSLSTTETKSGIHVTGGLFSGSRGAFRGGEERSGMVIASGGLLGISVLHSVSVGHSSLSTLSTLGTSELGSSSLGSMAGITEGSLASLGALESLVGSPHLWVATGNSDKGSEDDGVHFP